MPRLLIKITVLAAIACLTIAGVLSYLDSLIPRATATLQIHPNPSHHQIQIHPNANFLQ